MVPMLSDASSGWSCSAGCSRCSTVIVCDPPVVTLTTTSQAAAIADRNCRNRSGSCVGRPSRGSRACRCTMAAPARAAPIALSAICSGVIGRCGDIVGVWIAPVMAHVTMTFLPGKAWLRQTADAETRHAEQAPGEVLRFHFLCEQIVERGVLHAR